VIVGDGCALIVGHTSEEDPPVSTHPPHRVFQVATGNVGSEMITRLRDHPDLELVGLYCYSPEKVGRDAAW
jgi:hypothetical protein